MAGACATDPPRSYRCTGTWATGRNSYPPETERPGHHHTTKIVKLASNRISEAKKRYRAKTTAVFPSIGPLPYTVSNCLYQHAIQQGMISSGLVPTPPTIPHVGFCGMVAWGPMMTSSVGLVAVV